jgi:hypothetical protein
MEEGRPFRYDDGRIKAEAVTGKPEVRRSEIRKEEIGIRRSGIRSRRSDAFALSSALL